jgi:F-type H+-transporting ATPase subunit epsilon
VSGVKFEFSLVTPQRELVNEMVDQVDAPGIEGDFGVLAGHAPFMTTLREGQLRVHVFIDREEQVFEIKGGFADVTPQGLTILAEEAVEVQ